MTYGPAIVEALHAEHLICMDGAAFYRADKAAQERNARPTMDADD